jgi:hypothetical protein
MWARPGRIRVAGSHQLAQTTPSYLPGIYRRTYGTYYNGTKIYFNTASVTGTAVATDFQVSTVSTQFSYQYKGYFRADYSGIWTFNVTSDDYSHVWIGPDAVPPPEIAGAENGASAIGSYSFTVNLVANRYYPVRVMYGNGPGPGNLTMSYSHTGQSSSIDYTGKLFYNPVTNGF